MKNSNYFTFSFYEELWNRLKSRGYVPSTFSKSEEICKKVYFRHDIDFCPIIAHRFATFEARIGVQSTYFFMLNTPLYNVLHSQTRTLLKEILDMGHNVGLHYVLDGRVEEHSVSREIQVQIEFFSSLIGKKIDSFSIHRPVYLSGLGIESSKIDVPNIVNVYQFPFFQAGSYISDSNHNWRCGEPLEFLDGYSGDEIQILTHPIWWSEKAVASIEKIEIFQSNLSLDVKEYLADNINSYREHLRCLT